MGFEFRVLKERRQWALSSVSGPPCFRLFSKNHKKKKKRLVFWVRSNAKPLVFFSTFDLQKGQALPGPP